MHHSVYVFICTRHVITAVFNVLMLLTVITTISDVHIFSLVSIIINLQSVATPVNNIDD